MSEYKEFLLHEGHGQGEQDVWQEYSFKAPLSDLVLPYFCKKGKCTHHVIEYQAVLDKDRQIAELETKLKEIEANWFELSAINFELREQIAALAKRKEETCGFCETPCGNDWCPVKGEGADNESK